MQALRIAELMTPLVPAERATDQRS